MKSLGLDTISIPSTNNITNSFHRASLSITTQPNPKNEESIHLNYQETKAALDSLKTQKHVFRSEHSKKMLELEEKVKKNRLNIQSIDKKLEKFESSNLKLQRSITNEKQTRIEEFKSALMPLQTSADIIENTKLQISLKLEELEKELEITHESKEIKQENLDKKIMELNQINFEIQVCKRKIQEIQKDHNWDHMQVFQEAKIKSSVAKIKEEKKKAKKILSSIEFEINALRDSFENESRKMEELEHPETLKGKIEVLEKEILQLEEFLNLASIKHQCKGLWQVVVELSQSENYFIHDSIGKEQVNIVKSRKLELIDESKQAEWTLENKIFELNAEIKGLELQYYENVKNDKKNFALEKIIENKKRNFHKMNEEFEHLKKKNLNKLVNIDKWLEVNRKLLTFNQEFKFPGDESVIQEFILGFSVKKIDKAERDAIQNVVTRYMEKVNERNSYFFRISESGDTEKKALEDKTAFVLKVKAEIKSKDIEREKIQNQVDSLIAQEKVFMKELEKCKLEIESGRRKEVNDLISRSKVSHKSGKSVANVEEIKEKFTQATIYNVQTLRNLNETKMNLKISRNALADLIKNELHPELSNLTKDLSKKSIEIKNLEEDMIVLETSKEELLTKLGILADKKREELYSKVKDLSKKHGSAQLSSIEKLYNARASKESELVELELEGIKQQKLLSEKELKNSIEIVKVSTRAEMLQKQVRTLKRKQSQKKNHLSCFDIGNSFMIDQNNLSKAQETPFKAKSSRKINDNSNAQSMMKVNKAKSASKLSETAFVQDSVRSSFQIKSMRKLSENVNAEDSLRSNVRTPECSFRLHEFENESVFEIPMPAEPKYFLSENASEIEKKVFSGILPLLEGSILFKKGNVKTTEQFDPLDYSIKNPEETGYTSKKLKLNKQITKLEIRTVGKSGIDNCIMIDNIRSINSTPLTNAIIKAQNTSIDGLDMSLELIAKCSKEYREMKYSGKVNYNSNYFIVKSKETHYYPFYIVLKSGKAEFIAESIQDYYAWMKGLQSLINNKTLLEKLRFKIKSIE